MPDMTWREWLDVLQLSHRHAPDFYLPEDNPSDSTYAGTLRVAFEEGLNGVLCINNAPAVGFIKMKPFDPKKIQRLHQILWNQGAMVMLIVLTDTELRAFALTSRNMPNEKDVGTNNDPRLLEHLEILSSALKARELLVKTESGRLFTEYPDKLKVESRVDTVLLGNIDSSLTSLVQLGLPRANAQSLLMQVMIIAYLSHRGVLTSDYFIHATIDEATSLADTLTLGAKGNPEVLTKLFSALNRDFNGSIFTAPCSSKEIDSPEVTPNHCSILKTFLSGSLDMQSGQFRLIPYDFKYIPVALISAVYNNFLGASPGNRRKRGAYYTPLHLADMTVDQVWSELSEKQRLNGYVLDPSCGSGVFLVRMLERFVEYRRSLDLPTEWDDLIAVSNRLHGIDISQTALRLAASSIYIALLEQLDPPDIMELMAKGKMLPELIADKGPLRKDSFFRVKDHIKYDLIIGNPPWASKRNDDTEALSWAKKRKLPTPGKEIAWSFIWKSGQSLKEDGFCALLLPAMGFLHNANSASARVSFFNSHNTRRVINLSDLRFLLFDGATRPTALVVYAKKQKGKKNNSFEYWTPKADLFAQRKHAITLSHADRLKINSTQIIETPDIFTQRFWLKSRGEKLLQYLNSFASLNSFIDEYGMLSRRKKATSRFGWIIGQGFNRANQDRIDKPDYKTYKLDDITRYPFIEPSELRPLAIGTINNPSLNDPRVYRKNFSQGFKGPHILIKQGPTDSRIRASYSHQNLAFIDSIQSIVFPKSSVQDAKMITAVLSSRLATCYYFLTSSVWAFERDTVRQKELLSLPLPTNDEIKNSETMRKARNKLIKLVDEASNLNDSKHSSPLQPNNEPYSTSLLKKVDEAVYDLYDLSAPERMIVDDIFEQIIPSKQPNSASTPPLWKSCSQVDRKNYAEALQQALFTWFPEASIAITSPARNKDLVVLRMEIGNIEIKSQYNEKNGDLAKILPKLWDALPQQMGINFQLIPALRIFLDDALYLVKPTALRFWLRSSAQEEADDIVADLHQKLMLERQGGVK